MSEPQPLPANFHPAWIVRPLRQQGMRIPRFVWAAGEAGPPTGDLEVTWTVSEKHRRQMHIARFFAGAKDLLPCIRDVHVVGLSGGDLTLSGFEEIGEREYAQTWFCRLLRSGMIARGKPDDPTGRSGD